MQQWAVPQSLCFPAAPRTIEQGESRLRAEALTDAEIIDHCRSGELINDISIADHDDNDRHSLLCRCVALHNKRHIDLLALTNTAQFDALSGAAFFIRQHFFCGAIPKLEAPTLEMMEAVQKLVSKGGSDLLANAPNGAFRKWCVARPSQSEALIAAAKAGDAQSVGFLTFALDARGDAAIARSIASSYCDERRLSAMFALGRIKPANSKDAEDSIGVLLPFVDATNDEATRRNALISLFEICKLYPDLALANLPKAISTAAVLPTPGLLHSLTSVLWMHIHLLDRESVKLALSTLKATDPALKGLVDDLDVALKAVLGTPNGDLALDFVTDIFGANIGFELNQFKSLKHELASGDSDRLFNLLVRWLLSGNSNLGRLCSPLLRDGGESGPFNASTAELGLSGPDHVYLAYQTLGWLFIQDVTAASILVACLRGCDPEHAKQIGELLFDPLLVNYSGKTLDYLKTIKADDPAYCRINEALTALEGFIECLQIDPPIKELRPSEYQHSVQRRHAHDLMRSAQRIAEEQSVLFNLVSRSTLLYGHRSIRYMQHPGAGHLHPVSMDLQSHSYSFELPRSEIIDPVGMNMMLLRFRSLKRK